MPARPLRFYLFSFFLLSNPSPASAQYSLIEAIQNSEQSLVGVHAENTTLAGPPQTQMALDGRTGKLVAVKHASAAHFERFGAGVVIDPSGLIVTNFHVISYCTQVTVEFKNGTTVPARIVHLVPQYDFALLQIQAPFPLAPVEFADSKAVKLGDNIANVGSSYWRKGTISGGRIIGIGTGSSQKDPGDTDLLQLNINFYKGDSGGPLFDDHGRFVGLVVAKQTTIDRSGFAIPAHKIQAYTEEYLKSEKLQP